MFTVENESNKFVFENKDRQLCEDYMKNNLPKKADEYLYLRNENGRCLLKVGRNGRFITPPNAPQS